MKIYELAKTAGTLDAIRRFVGQTTKLTGEVSGVPKLLQRLFSSRQFITPPKHWAPNLLYNVTDAFTRGAYLGNPLNLAASIKEHGLGKTYLSHLAGQPIASAGAHVPRWEKALGLGLTLPFMGMDVYRAVTSDPEHRGEAIGQAAAGILASPITSSTGVLGQMLLHDPIRRAGGWIGRKFDKPSSTPMPEAAPPYGKLTPGMTVSQQLPNFQLSEFTNS